MDKSKKETTTIKKGDFVEVKKEFNPYKFYDGPYEVLFVEKIDENCKYAFLRGVGAVELRKLNRVSPP